MFGALEAATRGMDTYERTYSQLLQVQLDNDRAIAAAISENEQPCFQKKADTSLDSQLALQLHEHEVEKLVRPSRRKRNAPARAFRKLFRTLHVTKLVPRVNPVLPLSDSYVSEDRQRLLLRLDLYALQERVVKGDGNCQFRAIADQLWNDQERHPEVRQAAVAQLCQQPERYKDYVTTDYQQYVSSMSSVGEWGDHLTLQAAADAFNVRICVVSSFLENCIISIDSAQHQQEAGQLQQQQEQQQAEQAPGRVYDERTLWLAFWAEVHYNSLCVKVPESPSEGSASEDSSGSESSDPGGDSGSRSSKRLLGSKKLRRALIGH